MAFDEDKVADAVLALLSLTIFDESEYGARAWKGHDWAIKERLFEHGFIGNPKNRNKSVVLTVEGLKRSRELFDKMFGEKQ